MENDIFKEVKLINGSTCAVKIMRGVHISKANFNSTKHNLENPQDQLDASAFMYEELCLIDGKRKSYKYFLGLLIDDFNTIGEIISDQCTSFKIE